MVERLDAATLYEYVGSLSQHLFVFFLSVVAVNMRVSVLAIDVGGDLHNRLSMWDIGWPVSVSSVLSDSSAYRDSAPDKP